MDEITYRWEFKSNPKKRRNFFKKRIEKKENKDIIKSRQPQRGWAFRPNKEQRWT